MNYNLSKVARLILPLCLLFLAVPASADEDEKKARVRGAHEALPEGSRVDDIGERLPEFTLPNHNGELVDFHADRGDAKSVVVFFRSAVW
jgi:hypothetical protein